MLNDLILLAQDSKPAPAPGFNPIDLLIMFVPLILLYFLLIRPAQKRQEAEKSAITSNLNKDDRILTAAGIYGTVISVAEKEDEVVVKVADNVRLKMIKASIVKNFSHEERLKADKEAKEKAAKEGKK